MELRDSFELDVVDANMTMPELLMDDDFRRHREEAFAKRGIPESELQNVHGSPAFENHHRAGTWTRFPGATLIYYPFNPESKPLADDAKLKVEYAMENIWLTEALEAMQLPQPLSASGKGKKKNEASGSDLRKDIERLTKDVERLTKENEELRKENEEFRKDMTLSFQNFLKDYHKRHHHLAIRQLIQIARQKLCDHFRKPSDLWYDEWISSVVVGEESLTVDDLMHTKYESIGEWNLEVAQNFSLFEISNAVLNGDLSSSKRESYHRLFKYSFGVDARLVPRSEC